MVLRASGRFSCLPARAHLPPLSPGGSSISVTVDLSFDSARTALLEAQWEGTSSAPAQIPLTADAAGFKFKIGADGVSIVIPSGRTEIVALPIPAHDTQDCC